jgi:hypothetical protein
MNSARLKKEQEGLLKQIRANLDIQIPNDDKSINLQNVHDCLEVTNNRLIYSGTLKLLPDIATQKTEFECCLFTDIFVFFQKIPIQPSEQRGIEESYRYILKEHQRDASNGRHQRPRPAGGVTKFIAAQNFILTPVIRLEHLLIKKKACGGARSFYVIDTDKKQLIEVEANSKDDLEKWLEWIEKARKPFEKSKPSLSISSSMNDKSSQLSSVSNASSSSTLTTRSAIIEEQPDMPLVEPNQVKVIEKQTLIEDTPDSLMNAIAEKDKELKRLLHEKEMLLARLLNIPQQKINDAPGYIASTRSTKSSALEAITFAASCHNQLMQTISQTQNQAVKDKKSASIDTQSLWNPITQLGEQLTLALRLTSQRKHDGASLRELRSQNTIDENGPLRRNSSSSGNIHAVMPSSTVSSTSQMFSEFKDSLSMSSLHSSESLGSVAFPTSHYQTASDLISLEPRSPPLSSNQLSSITDLDETLKSPPPSSQSKQLHVATEVVERFDEGVFDDGAGSQTEEDENNSVAIADSDDEDEIEHFDSTDSVIAPVDNLRQPSTSKPNEPSSNSLSMEAQSVNLDLYDDDDLYDNLKPNTSTITNNDNNIPLRNVSEA